MADQIQIPAKVLERSQRDHEMRERTHDRMLQDLWRHAEDGATNLYFILDAQAVWKTDSAQWHDLTLGSVAPDNCDPPGSGPTYVMGPQRGKFGCRIDVPPLCRNPIEDSQRAILGGIRKAQVLADALSLATSQDVVLRAAVRQEASWEDGEFRNPPTPRTGSTHFLWPHENIEALTYRIIDDNWVEKVLKPLVSVLVRVPDPDVRAVLESAINWHAQANSLHDLGRYVHYWASIELLGAFFYRYLDPQYAGRQAPSDVEAKVLRMLLDMNSKNYRSTVKDCHQLLHPSIRQQILALCGIVLPIESQVRGLLFGTKRTKAGAPVDGARSMFDIRNDIAHGNISHHMRDYLDKNSDVLERFRAVSQDIILATLDHAAELCRHRSETFGGASAPNSNDTNASSM